MAYKISHISLISVFLILPNVNCVLEHRNSKLNTTKQHFSVLFKKIIKLHIGDTKIKKLQTFRYLDHLRDSCRVYETINYALTIIWKLSLISCNLYRSSPIVFAGQKRTFFIWFHNVSIGDERSGLLYVQSTNQANFFAVCTILLENYFTVTSLIQVSPTETGGFELDRGTSIFIINTTS